MMRAFIAGAWAAALMATITGTANAELIGLWLFDEGDGEIVSDHSGHGFHGMIENDAEWTDGRYGSGLTFQSGWVRVNHHRTLDLKEWSISVWVKIPAATASYQMVAGKESWPDRNYSMWILPTTMTFGFTSGANDIQVQSGEVGDDKWHHLVGTYDGEFLRGYVDLVLRGERPADGVPNTCECPFFIGAQPPNGGGPTVGAIDEAAIYSHALEDDEISLIHAGLAELAVRANGKASVAWGELKRGGR